MQPPGSEDGGNPEASHQTGRDTFHNTGPGAQYNNTGDGYQVNYSGSGDPTFHYGANISYYNKQKSDEEMERLLRSLRYPEMNTRLNEIKPHAEHTFEWVFEPTNNDINDTLEQQLSNMSITHQNIAHWFRAGQGIYLILGKPGAGKSTFMKFLSRDSRIQDALKEWSGDSKILLLFHSFWGLSEKRPAHNWKGFLASLLSQLIWGDTDFTVADGSPSARKIEYDDWSVDELQDLVFCTIKTSPHNHCILIDALDEAELDQISDIFAWIREITDQLGSTCKICIASRRLSCLNSRFIVGSMELDRFTPKDLEIYAKRRLQSVISDLPVTTTGAEHEAKLEDFVGHLCRKAQGVWIWLYHVLKHLENEIKFYELVDWKKLDEELELLPGDLYDLYGQALARSRHKLPHKEKERSTLLKFVSDCTLPLFRVLVACDDDLRNKYLKRRVAENNDGHLGRLCNSFRNRVYELSGCLLESTTDWKFSAETYYRDPHHDCWFATDRPGDEDSQSAGLSVDMNTQMRSCWQTQPWRLETVQYIHRTVYEYLVQQGEITIDDQDPPYDVQLVIESQLVCLIESVQPMTYMTLYNMCTKLGVPDTDYGCQLAGTIGSVCRSIVAARLECMVEPSIRSLLSVNDETWFCPLVQGRKLYGMQDCLDYTGFLYCHANPKITIRILDQNGARWSDHYKGYLALCASALGPPGYRDEENDVLLQLQTHGADFQANHVSQCAMRLGLYRVDSYIDRLLREELARFVTAILNSSEYDVHWRYRYRNHQWIYKIFDRYDMDDKETEIFVTYDSKFSYAEQWEYWEHKVGQESDSNKSDSYAWIRGMTIVTFNAGDIVRLLRDFISPHSWNLTSFEELKAEFLNDLVPLASAAHIPLVNHHRKDCMWFRVPEDQKSNLLEAALFQNPDKYLGIGIDAVYFPSGDDVRDPISALPRSLIKVPPGVVLKPLDQGAEMKNGKWEDVCALREYFAALK